MIQQEKMAAFGLLAAGIAHEVGNPLAALSSLVQILKRRGPDPYTAEKLDLAARQLQRIERTIRELIDFSRPASTVATRFRIGEVVDEALGIAKYYQRTKQRSITTEIPADLPAVLGVRDYLTQVVLNLVLNAIDATDDQGRIHVAAQADDGWLVLTVEDDGRGISLADRCRLFQPFFTTKPHGTGLGLFVSRQILEDFCRDADAFAPSPGRGSTFFVRLPVGTTVATERGPELSGLTGRTREARGHRRVRLSTVASRGADCDRSSRRSWLRPASRRDEHLHEAEAQRKAKGHVQGVRNGREPIGDLAAAGS